MKLIFVLFLFFFLQAWSQTVYFQEIEQENLIQLNGYKFGVSVATFGNYVVVGSSGEVAGTNTGAAYVYLYDGGLFVLQQKLASGDNLSNQYFGFDVDVDGSDTGIGTHVVVGAYGGLRNHGSVYIYSTNGATWSLMQKIMALDSVPGNRFGFALALNGNLLAVGAPGMNGNIGVVYIFNYTGTSWIQQTEIFSPNYFPLVQFGYSIDFAGNTLVVGAPCVGCSHATVGYAFVYTLSGSTFMPQALSTDAVGRAQFGFAVATDGNTVVVSANQDNINNEPLGSVFVYTNNGTYWNLLTKIVQPGASTLGDAVTVYENTIVVGSVRQKSAYIFTLNGNSWSQYQEVISTVCGSFGNALVLDQNALYVGDFAFGTNIYTYDNGMVHVFTQSLVMPGLQTSGSISNQSIAAVVLSILAFIIILTVVVCIFIRRRRRRKSYIRENDPVEFSQDTSQDLPVDQKH